jgi:hypothetical protein
MAGSRYKVVQWATGAMGGAVLRGVIDHPALELVGLYVYSDAKQGLDAGQLVDRPLTGVLATRSVDEILALEADVVIHCARLVPPYGSHDEDLMRLLRSGKNVISINGYARPVPWDEVRAEQLQQACIEGGSSLTSGGLNPGYIGEQMALVATGVCQQLDHVKVTENASTAKVQNPNYVFDELGFGANPDTIDPNDPTWGPATSMNGMYAEVLAAMARRLNMTLERVETAHRLFAASADLTVAAGVIPAGTVSHTQWQWHGYCAGEHRLTMCINWFMETSHLSSAEPSLWEVEIAGKPGVRFSMELTRQPGDSERVAREMQAVAGSVINSIAQVCAAPPGVLDRPLATPYQFVVQPR